VSDPVLLTVAHGSRDPEAKRTVRSLAGRVAGLAPGTEVRTAFVQHAGPSLAEALTAAGQRQVVIVPLLLSAGYHLGQDIGAAAARAGVPVAAPLGPGPGLVPALVDRLRAAGTPPGTPVVLAAAGSTDPRAAGDARNQAALIGAHLQAPALAAFASAGRPTVAEAVADLAARTGGPVAVASYLLAPGVFAGRLRASGAAWVSAPLGDHPAVAGLILERFSAVADRRDRRLHSGSAGSRA
jgi:sirohydrochlorin ferrochelatase